MRMVCRWLLEKVPGVEEEAVTGRLRLNMDSVTQPQLCLTAGSTMEAVSATSITTLLCPAAML